MRFCSRHHTGDAAADNDDIVVVGFVFRLFRGGHDFIQRFGIRARLFCTRGDGSLYRSRRNRRAGNDVHAESLRCNNFSGHLVQRNLSDALRFVSIRYDDILYRRIIECHRNGDIGIVASDCRLVCAGGI